MDEEVALRYINRKKRRKRAAIVSGICSLAITVFIIIAFCMLTVDRFTVTTTNDPELCLTVDENKLEQTTALHAPPLLKATDTQYTDVIETLDESLGSQNTEYYFAYSFYLGSMGKATSINYNMAMSLNKYSNNIEEAIRVMVIRNGVKTVYAKSDVDGNAKPIYYGENHEVAPEQIGVTKSFTKNKNIIVEAYEIIPGEFDKYTIVMWIDGWESVNEMKGGVFQADVKFSTNSIN